MRIRGSRAGFTLIEVTVALVISGMALVAAAALFNGLAQRAEAVERAGRHADRDANAERLLRTLFENMDLRGDSTSPPVAGDGRSMRFRAWCDEGRGSFAPCSVRLSIQQDARLSFLQLDLAGADTTRLILRRGFREGRLRYLRTAREGGEWTDTWPRLVAPTAIAVIIERDTLLLPVWGGG
jgi:prepilin-type N-terminal cleavage/methylation domain-containing protein